MSKDWASHVEFAVLFVTLVSGFFLFDAKFERSNERIDGIISEQTHRYAEQTQRSDRLYEMFIEVVKDKKERCSQ